MFMKHALDAAKNCENEIAIGAVIVKDNEIIASACNRKEILNDVSAHAEILALREAAKKLDSWRLYDCDLYVTLEPCPMCAWAIVQSGIRAVYFGSYDTNYGALGSVIDVRQPANSKLKVYGGIMEEECNKILKDCFEKIRNRKN